MPGSVTLRVIAGPLTGEAMQSDEHTTITIGRAKDCSFRLPRADTSASRHHCLIEVAPPDVVLRDLGSRHGTRVNGERVGGRGGGNTPHPSGDEPESNRELRNGDEVRVGKTVLRVEIALPTACGDCGASLSRSGTCVECAPTAVAGENTPESTHCSRCGRDATRELTDGRGGDYTCERCRQSVQDDPLEVERSPRVRPGGSTTQPIGVPGHEIVQRIGAGGMGAVYLARRHVDGVWVAVKVLLAHVAVDETARQRFDRESSIVEQLVHPRIVQFYERGTLGSAFYFAMEFCPAGSAGALAARRGGKLQLGEALPIVLQTLDALAFAHDAQVVVRLAEGREVLRRGVVHRDVKPDNILLGGSERGWSAKLGDFGLAKSFAAAGLSGCTVSGHTGGALPFMPPEQVRDFRHATPSSDLWATGATLYTLLAGRDPRDLRNQKNPLHAILDGRVIPLRKAAPTVPRSIARFVERSIAHDIGDRYPDALTMAAALRDAAYGAGAAAGGLALVPALRGGGDAPQAILHLAPAGLGDLPRDDAARIREQLHRAVTSRVDLSMLRAVVARPGGLVAITANVQAALSIARAIRVEHHGRVVPVSRTLHVGVVEIAGEGMPAGPAIGHATALAALRDADRDTTVRPGGPRLEADRLLLTEAAVQHIDEEGRSGFVDLGTFRVPGGEGSERILLEPRASDRSAG